MRDSELSRDEAAVGQITPADISDPKELIARAAELSAELRTPIAPGFEALVFKASRGIEDIYELTYTRKDGSHFPAIVSVTALRDAEEGIIGYLLIGTDNTARHEVEAVQAQLDEVLLGSCPRRPRSPSPKPPLRPSSTLGNGPQIGEGYPEFAEHPPQDRKRQSQDVARYSLNALDEGSCPAVDAKSTCERQGLTTRHVRADLRFARRAELHHGAVEARDGNLGAGVDQEMTRVENAPAP